mmetsp:Transcript_20933/g.38208  ORF Transcript_20933/g.38208 Transcript_20933/m.38208 type:complete len:200 (+) Transcript_20933:672-1271(+)
MAGWSQMAWSTRSTQKMPWKFTASLAGRYCSIFGVTHNGSHAGWRLQPCLPHTIHRNQCHHRLDRRCHSNHIRRLRPSNLTIQAIQLHPVALCLLSRCQPPGHRRRCSHHNSQVLQGCLLQWLVQFRHTCHHLTDPSAQLHLTSLWPLLPYQRDLEERPAPYICQWLHVDHAFQWHPPPYKQGKAWSAQEQHMCRWQCH